MDFDRLQRIFGRMLETHGMIFGGALAAVVGLIFLVLLTRWLRNRKNNPKPAKDKKSKDKAVKKPAVTEIDGTTDLLLDDDVSMTMEVEDDIDLSQMVDNDAMLDMGAPVPDQLDPQLADQFAHLDDDQMVPQANMAGMGDLDDITIPKVGEAPPPRKSRFFSSSWLSRDKSPAAGDTMMMSGTDITFTPEDSKTRASAAECARLADIERKMLALRELYEAGLIAPEVYVLKARELAHQV